MEQFTAKQVSDLRVLAKFVQVYCHAKHEQGSRQPLSLPPELAGWSFLLLFLVVLTVQLTGLPRVAWAERPVYVLIFAFFSLSTSAFLAYSARKSAASMDWQEPA